MIKSDGPYVIVGDDSGHEYVIPGDKIEEWYELDWEDEQPDDLGWADSLCYGSLLIHSYEIE